MLCYLAILDKCRVPPSKSPLLRLDSSVRATVTKFQQMGCLAHQTLFYPHISGVWEVPRSRRQQTHCVVRSGLLVHRRPSSHGDGGGPRVTEISVLCSVAQSCPTLCDPMDRSPPGSSVHGDSPGKDTGVGCYALLQGIFLPQGSNPHLLHLLH